MKQIVICGAGFGGLNCALELSKLMPEAKITLVDESPYHVLHAFLYEVATGDEETAPMMDMVRSVAVPISMAIKGKNITFQQARVESVNAQTKTVKLDHGSLNYDYLVMALGSTSNYYGIPGAEQYSLPFKTLRDALAIRNRVEFAVEAARLSGKRDKLRFVIAGGGFAGVELAAELKGLLDFLSWKNNYPRHMMDIMIVEGAPTVMPGMPERVSRDTFDRLESLNINLQLKSLITNVTDTFLELNTGDKLHYDLLVWTAGVRAITVPMEPEMELEKGNRIATNEFFQAKADNNIFVIGDQCCFIGSDGRPLPGTATQATDHGKYVAHALEAVTNNRKPEPYKCKDFGYAIALGGKWAIGIAPGMYWKGYLTSYVMKVEWYRYLKPIIGRWNAFKLVWFQAKLYSRND